MDELVPVILGAAMGAVIGYLVRGRWRDVAAIAAVIVAGVAATVASGEYRISWAYLLPDLAEAACGLALGYAGVTLRIAARVSSTPK